MTCIRYVPYVFTGVGGAAGGNGTSGPHGAHRRHFRGGLLVIHHAAHGARARLHAVWIPV